MIRIGVVVAAVVGGDQALASRAPPRGIPRPIRQGMGFFGACYAARRAQRRAFSPSSCDQPKGEMMTITLSPSRKGVRRTRPTISNYRDFSLIASIKFLNIKVLRHHYWRTVPWFI